MKPEQLLEFLKSFKQHYQGNPFVIPETTKSFDGEPFQILGVEYVIVPIDFIFGDSNNRRLAQNTEQRTLISSYYTGVDSVEQRPFSEFVIQSARKCNLVLTVPELSNRIFDLENPGYYKTPRYKSATPILTISNMSGLTEAILETEEELKIQPLYMTASPGIYGNYVNNMPKNFWRLVAVPYVEYEVFVKGGLI